MNIKLLSVLVTLFFTLSPQLSRADTAPPTTNIVDGKLKVIDLEIMAKVKAGQKTSAELTDEFAKFDVLMAAKENGSTDDQASIILNEAAIYDLILHDSAKSVPLYRKLVQDYPTSKSAIFYKRLNQKPEDKGPRQGTQFPEFSEKDVTGQPLSVANYKGNVVLIDFWATWCGPCKAELPNVRDIYQKRHADGFEVIGVSLDSDQSKLTKFLSQNNIPWPQYFDGLGWKNKLAVNYEVKSIPATYLLDGNGKIIGKNLRGASLQMAVEDALKQQALPANHS